jgi:signal transduction histidine kinase
MTHPENLQASLSAVLVRIADTDGQDQIIFPRDDWTWPREEILALIKEVSKSRQPELSRLTAPSWLGVFQMATRENQDILIGTWVFEHARWYTAIRLPDIDHQGTSFDRCIGPSPEWLTSPREDHRGFVCIAKGQIVNFPGLSLRDGDSNILEKPESDQSHQTEIPDFFSEKIKLEHQAGRFTLRREDQQLVLFTYRVLVSTQNMGCMAFKITPLQTDELLHEIEDLHDLLQAYKMALWRIGHDIRTPLNAISGFWQLAQLRGESLNASPMIKGHIKEALDHICQIALEAAIIPSLRSPSHASGLKADVRNSVNIAERMCKQMIEQKSLTVHVSGDDCETTMPPGALVEVVANLLTNAIKFSPANETITVTWEKEPLGESFSLKFINRLPNGEGHSWPDLSKRDRITSSTGESRGLGVGLMICQYLSKQYGGEISVQPMGQDFCLTSLRVPLAHRPKIQHAEQ